MWVSKTPLRASFLGGGTDYPSHFRSYPGAVLGGTIDKYVFIQALPLAPIAEQKFRVTYRTTESVNHVNEIRHPVIRETLKLHNWTDPLNIATMSDLPGGTGLGSSSAFTVGFINLIHRMKGIELTRYELARQSIHMEQVILNENVGVQDQIHAAFGGLARYEFTGDSFSIEPLRLTTRRLSLINRSMILVYTGAQRSASEILNSQEKRTKSGSNADYLREMYEMTKIGATILEAEGDDLAALNRFAELLDQGWKLKRQLGKLLGAGGGGFVLFVVDPSLHPAFEARFGRQNIIPISMTNGGSTVASIA